MVIYNFEESRENKINKLGNNQQGVTLILVTLILVISSVLAIALITYYQAAALTSEVEAYRMQALYLAESGINKVIQKLRNNETVANPYSESQTFFPGQPGSYQGGISVSRTASGNETTLISEATVPLNQPRQAKRVLKVIYNFSTYKLIYWEDNTKGR